MAVLGGAVVCYERGTPVGVLLTIITAPSADTGGLQEREAEGIQGRRRRGRRGGVYRATSLIRNAHPPRTTIGP